MRHSAEDARTTHYTANLFGESAMPTTAADFVYSNGNNIEDNSFWIQNEADLAVREDMKNDTGGNGFGVKR